MRKPPRAREGLALALPRSSSLAQNLCCSPCREKQFTHSPIQTFTVTRCTKWRAEQWIFHVSHHLETKHLSVCRAQFCTAFLPALENIMYASHLAASLQYPCHQMKLPPLNNVRNTEEHKPSYIRKCGLLQTSSATKPKFFFAINRFDKKPIYYVIFRKVWTADTAFSVTVLQHTTESFLFSLVPAFQRFKGHCTCSTAEHIFWSPGQSHACWLSVRAYAKHCGFRDINSAKHYF